MLELDAIIGALIGVVTGLLPSIVIAFWRECRERALRKERQAQRDHALEMKRLENQQQSIHHGLNRGYLVTIEDGNATYEPPGQPLTNRPNSHSQG